MNCFSLSFSSSPSTSLAWGDGDRDRGREGERGGAVDLGLAVDVSILVDVVVAVEELIRRLVLVFPLLARERRAPLLNLLFPRAVLVLEPCAETGWDLLKRDARRTLQIPQLVTYAECYTL